MLLYQLHEWNRAWLEPFSTWAEANAHMLSSPHSWMSSVPGASRMAAGYELLHRIGKDYEKPEFGIHEVEVDGRKCPVVEREVLRTPFCRLLRFKRFSDDAGELRNMKDDPAVLVVAPLSGGPATYVDDGVTGVLVDTTDPDALTAAAASALDLAAALDADVRAAQAQALVEERFSITTMASALAAIYREVVRDTAGHQS